MNSRLTRRRNAAILVGAGIVGAVALTAYKLREDGSVQASSRRQLVEPPTAPTTFERWGMEWAPMDAPAARADDPNETVAAATHRRRQALRTAPPDELDHPALWLEPLCHTEPTGFPLDGDGTWPSMVVDALQRLRDAQFIARQKNDSHVVAAVDLDRGLKVGFLPGELEVYAYRFAPQATGPERIAYAVHKPADYVATEHPFVTGGSIGTLRVSGPVAQDYITDLDGDGTAELVVGTQIRNGMANHLDVLHFLEVGPDAALTEVLTLMQNVGVVVESENGTGYVYRRIHRLGPNELMVTVRFENPDAGVGPRRLGRVLLQRGGRGQRFEAVGRHVDSPDQESRVRAGL